MIKYMTWQEQLQLLENSKQWDQAIEFMQHIITQNPHDLKAYLSMNYLLMNLLVEEDYDDSKYDYYASLTKKYFDESYQHFSHDPEYLFYTGKTAVMSEWFFGIEVKDYKKMLSDAMRLEPDNLLYQWSYYINLDLNNYENKKKVCAYTKIALEENSPIKKLLLSKGSLGTYLFGLITNWSKKMLKEEQVCSIPEA
jgi:hypothetical protein